MKEITYNLAIFVRHHHRGYHSEMLRITTENKRGKLFLSVEGSLSGPRVATLEQCWRELYATTPKAKFCVNLCGVSFIDNAGKALLKEMYRLGADLLAEGCLNQAIVTEIAGPKEKKAPRESTGSDDTKGSSIIFYVIFFCLLLVPAFTSAQAKSAVPPPNAPTGVLKLTLEQSVALAINLPFQPGPRRLRARGRADGKNLREVRTHEC